MTVSFRTFARHLPATPLDLLPPEWAVEHWCNTCRQRVATDQLIAHARGHEDFPQAPEAGTMTPDVTGPDPIGPHPTKEASRD